jgi:3-deoxy-manno-octulosonate cytidylyltransferase (CMP-KDO synthetase)
MMNEIVILIPARLDGVRLPRKVLTEFSGLPMVEHVRRRASLNRLNSEVYVVSGDREVLDKITEFNGLSIQTFKEHENGTSRCAEAAAQLRHNYIIIAQGDEILLLPRHLDLIMEEISNNPTIRMLNSVSKLQSNDELIDESIVKCLLSIEKKVIMMFRKPPISILEKNDFKMYYKVHGLFAFEKSLLAQFSSMPPTNFEERESIEQMRLLENNIEIRAVILDKSYPSINIQPDMEKVLGDMNYDNELNQILKIISNEVL